MTVAKQRAGIINPAGRHRAVVRDIQIGAREAAEARAAAARDAAMAAVNAEMGRAFAAREAGIEAGMARLNAWREAEMIRIRAQAAARQQPARERLHNPAHPARVEPYVAPQAQQPVQAAQAAQPAFPVFQGFQPYPGFPPPWNPAQQPVPALINAPQALPFGFPPHEPWIHGLGPMPDALGELLPPAQPAINHQRMNPPLTQARYKDANQALHRQGTSAPEGRAKVDMGLSPHPFYDLNGHIW